VDAEPSIVPGIVVGVLLAVVCGFVFGKGSVAVGARLGIVNIAVGYIIGFAVLKACKESGPLPGFVAGTSALCAALIGQYIMYHDFTALFETTGMTAPWSNFFEATTKMNPLNWLFMGFAFWRGYRIADG
jgi:hypothetical protein